MLVAGVDFAALALPVDESAVAGRRPWAVFGVADAVVGEPEAIGPGGR